MLGLAEYVLLALTSRQAMGDVGSRSPQASSDSGADVEAS